jgi:maltooligosyltrehalose trehalohydrolase
MRDEVKRTRRLPVGAEVLARGGVEFRVWAPRPKAVHLVIEGPARRPGVAREVIALAAEAGGYFSGIAPAAGHGTLYRFRLDDDEALYPDPASRYQPQVPHGPSQVIDPATMTGTTGS